MTTITPIEKVRTVRAAGGKPILSAAKPLPSLFPIVNVIGGEKIVGFVMVGGTQEQFEYSVEQSRAYCAVHGWKPGTYIHATAGSVVR